MIVVNGGANECVLVLVVDVFLGWNGITLDQVGEVVALCDLALTFNGGQCEKRNVRI